MDTYVQIEKGDWGYIEHMYAVKTAHIWCINNLPNEVKLLDRSRTKTEHGPFYLVFKTPEEAVQFKLSVDRDVMLEGFWD